MRKLAPALTLTLAALLAACSGAPPKRVYPPQASVQQVRVLADGQWEVRIRVQNFSTVPMRFSRLQATLSVGGEEAARFDLDPGLGVGPGSTEVIAQTVAPAAGPKAAVDRALAERHAIRYQLAGRLASSDPGTDDPFDYSSALDPVPGLTDVLR